MAPAIDLPSLSFLDAERSMPLMKLPLRTVLIDTPDGRILFSPASTLTPAQHASAGAISDIVVPSLMHFDGVRPAVAAHPEARLWGPEGAEAKLPGVRWHGILGRDPWPFEDQLSLVPIAGMPKFNECVFLHRPSRSLLVTDLAFNLEDPRGLGAWLFLHLFGTYRRFGVSRLFVRFVQDRPAFDAAIAQVAALPFEHLVPSHGAIVSHDAKARFVAALRERGVHAHA